MKRTITVIAMALCASASLLPADVAAQTEGPWKWQAMMYAYLPTIGGRTTFPPTGAGSSASVDAEQILDNLNGVFMGSLEAHNGRWGAFTDIMYMDIGDSKSGTRDLTLGSAQLPAGVNANVSFDLKGSVWTLGGSYRVSTNPGGTTDVLVGARLLDLKQTLGWAVTGNVGAVALANRAGNSETSMSNWDAIIGVKGNIALSDDRKWFAPYYIDVGTGESDMTWQAMAGIGYAFGWGDVVAAWRYLDYKMKSGKPVEELNFNGPAIAAVIRW